MQCLVYRHSSIRSVRYHRSFFQHHYCWNRLLPKRFVHPFFSLWGGSAGARMAAWLGSYGTASFGEQAYPQPGAVIMQYTGLGEVYGNEPPTYACVGDRDYIADERVMRWRIETIRSQGTPAEIEVFPGLAHGFGLGTGTSAEGWLDHAVAFWEENT